MKKLLLALCILCPAAHAMTPRAMDDIQEDQRAAFDQNNPIQREITCFERMKHCCTVTCLGCTIGAFNGLMIGCMVKMAYPNITKDFMDALFVHTKRR